MATTGRAARQEAAIALGLAIGVIETLELALLVHLGEAALRPGDTEISNANDGLIVALCGVIGVTVVALPYCAMRLLRIPDAGALTFPVAAAQCWLTWVIWPRLPGHGVWKALVLAVLLSLELLAAVIWLPVHPAIRTLREPSAPRTPAADSGGRILKPASIGLLLGVTQRVLLFYLELWGGYVPSSAFLRLSMDRRMLSVVTLLGIASIVMTYLALRNLVVRFAGWLTVPTVLVQFELCAFVGSAVQGFGAIFVCAAVLPAELILLSLWLGNRPAPPG